MYLVLPVVQELLQDRGQGGELRGVDSKHGDPRGISFGLRAGYRGLVGASGGLACAASPPRCLRGEAAKAAAGGGAAAELTVILAGPDAGGVGHGMCHVVLLVCAVEEMRHRPCEVTSKQG